MAQHLNRHLGVIKTAQILTSHLSRLFLYISNQPVPELIPTKRPISFLLQAHRMLLTTYAERAKSRPQHDLLFDILRMSLSFNSNGQRRTTGRGDCLGRIADWIVPLLPKYILRHDFMIFDVLVGRIFGRTGAMVHSFCRCYLRFFLLISFCLTSFATSLSISLKSYIALLC